MDTIKLNQNKVKMVAHRGVSKLERENTNAAFIAAGNRSYFGIETDVHKSKDGLFVAIHDSSTSRVTNGVVEVIVEEHDYNTIKEVILPDLDESTHRQDLRIPLMLDYIKICKKYDKVCVLEVKTDFSKEELADMVEVIRQEDYLDQVIFIAFGRENCVLLRELLPEQPIQWLTSQEFTEEMKEFIYKHHLDLDIRHDRLTKELVDELHANNVVVNTWTCDDPQRAEELIEMGVDFITSNILE